MRTTDTTKTQVGGHAALAGAREALASLRASLAVLGDVAKTAERLPWNDLLELAAEFESSLNRRSGFDLAFTEFAMGEAAQRRSGTTDTCGFLSRVLGISRAQARERIEAVRLLGDVEPEDDGGDLPPGDAGLFGGADGPDADAEMTDEQAQAAAEEAAARAAMEEKLRRARERSREQARRKAAEGGVTPAKLDALRRELRRLRPGGRWTAEEIKARVLACADSWNADRIRRETRALVEKSNAHAAPDPFADLRERDFWMSRNPEKDGSFAFRGRMPAHSAALMRKYLNTHAVKGAGIELPEGIVDRRSAGQRNMDALSKMIDGAMNAEPGAHAAGHATIVVTFRGGVVGGEPEQTGQMNPADPTSGDAGAPGGDGNDAEGAARPDGDGGRTAPGASAQEAACGCTGAVACGRSHHAEDHSTHTDSAGAGAEAGTRDGADVGAGAGVDAGATNPATMTGSTNVGIDLTLAQVLRLGLDTHWYAALIDGAPAPVGMNLRLGRSARTASAAQRIALQVFDGCCQYPGCDRPLDECDIHHIVAWLAGGRTDIENLVPLCRTHHVNNDDTWSNPHKGHMTPRSPENGHRSGWSGPIRPSPPPEPGETGPVGEFPHSLPDRARCGIEFNDSPAARSAEGFSPPPPERPLPHRCGATSGRSTRPAPPPPTRREPVPEDGLPSARMSPPHRTNHSAPPPAGLSPMPHREDTTAAETSPGNFNSPNGFGSPGPPPF